MDNAFLDDVPYSPEYLDSHRFAGIPTKMGTASALLSAPIGAAGGAAIGGVPGAVAGTIGGMMVPIGAGFSVDAMARMGYGPSMRKRDYLADRVGHQYASQRMRYNGPQLSYPTPSLSPPPSPPLPVRNPIAASEEAGTRRDAIDGSYFSVPSPLDLLGSIPMAAGRMMGRGAAQAAAAAPLPAPPVTSASSGAQAAARLTKDEMEQLLARLRAFREFGPGGTGTVHGAAGAAAAGTGANRFMDSERY